MAELFSSIEIFTELSIQSSSGKLSAAEQAKMDAIEKKLRGEIDGAVRERVGYADGLSLSGQDAMAAILGGQSSSGPSMVDDSDIDLFDDMPDLPLGGATSFDMGEDGGLDALLGGMSARVSGLVELPADIAGAVSSRDRKRLRAVNVQVSSGYTPPIARGYLSDYFGGEIQAVPTAQAAPRRAILAAGGHLELPAEVQTYFGVAPEDTPEEPDPLENIDLSRPPEASPVSSMSPAEYAEGGTHPISIYLLSGAVRKGECASFDPDSGFVKYIMIKGMPEMRLSIRDVREIHFAPAPPLPVQAPTGQRLSVTLINGQRLTGTSPDYAPGVASMKVVPNPRPFNIDYVWVPSWAVKGIELV